MKINGRRGQVSAYKSLPSSPEPLSELCHHGGGWAGHWQRGAPRFTAAGARGIGPGSTRGILQLAMDQHSALSPAPLRHISAHGPSAGAPCSSSRPWLPLGQHGSSGDPWQSDRNKQRGAGSRWEHQEQMLLALKGTAFPKPPHPPRVGSSLQGSFLSPEPSSQCLHLSQPIQHKHKGSPKTRRQRLLRETLLPPIYLSVVWGGLLYGFSQAFFFFPSPKSGWSFTLPDSISRLSHPFPSGRLPDGAPLGHICSLFGKQGLIQVLS